MIMMDRKQSTTQSCPKRAFTNFKAASEEAKRFSRNSGHTVSPYQCARCQQYHNKTSRALLDDTDLLILACIARGLRDREIANDLQITGMAVTQRVLRMMHRTGTISRPNLIFFATHHGFIKYAKVMGDEDAGSRIAEG